jgi:hypothetical protein
MELLMITNACSVCGSPHHLGLIHDHMRQAAIWFPPYGNLGIQPQGATPKSTSPSFAEALKTHEDKIADLIGNLDAAERAIAYKYLHASGMRIATAEEDLRKAIRKEIGQDSR